MQCLLDSSVIPRSKVCRDHRELWKLVEGDTKKQAKGVGEGMRSFLGKTTNLASSARQAAWFFRQSWISRREIATKMSYSGNCPGAELAELTEGTEQDQHGDSEVTCPHEDGTHKNVRTSHSSTLLLEDRRSE